jgi:preprotein translocase subunit SecG
MLTLLLIIHGIVTLLLITVILLQKSEGGGGLMGGSQGNLFSVRGSANFLTHTTAILATIFMANSLLIAYVTTHHTKTVSVLDAPMNPSLEKARR